MYYSERLVQVFKEQLSQILMKYGFNNWFPAVGFAQCL